MDASLLPGIDDLVDALLAPHHLGAGRVQDIAPTSKAVPAHSNGVPTIIKEPEPTPVNPELLEGTAEQALFTTLRDTEGVVRGCLAHADHAGALEAMAQLRPFIDAFFDSVLVMDKDELIRRNRLAILTRIHELFAGVADFRRIQTG